MLLKPTFLCFELASRYANIAIWKAKYSVLIVNCDFCRSTFTVLAPQLGLNHMHTATTHDDMIDVAVRERNVVVHTATFEHELVQFFASKKLPLEPEDQMFFLVEGLQQYPASISQESKHKKGGQENYCYIVFRIADFTKTEISGKSQNGNKKHDHNFAENVSLNLRKLVL